jgi:hypothetical protein
MFLSLEDYLLAIDDHLPTVLVSSEALSDIRRIGRELPPVRSACFECPLGEIGGVTDFSVCADGAVEHLSGRNAFAKLDDTIVTSSPWQRFRAFCEGWSDSALLRHISNVWLEFDRSRHSVPVSRPSVFFGVHRTKDRRRLAEAGVSLLRGESLPIQLAQALTFSLSALPKEARIFQVGVMLSRENTPVRLCMIGFTRDRLLDYLLAIRWPGSIEDVRRILRSISPHLPILAVDFDLDSSVGGVGPRLGLECYMGREHQLVNVHPNWERFLEQLIRSGLCLPSERDALLAWPGYTLRDVIFPSVFFRGLNHVKVVWEPPGFVYAKAYLVFLHAWRRRRVSRMTF